MSTVLTSRFEQLLAQYGAVLDGIADDAIPLQNAIDAASLEGIECRIPDSVLAIKINSGITLYSNSIRLTCNSTVLLDCSGINTGVAITVDSKATDTNIAPLANMVNHIRGFRIVGGGVAGVTAIRFNSVNGKTYFYQIKECSFDNFAVTVDFSSNSFGIAFVDVAMRSALGGTLLQCIAGAGANYGEGYNLTRCMFYNSTRVLYNSNSASTFRFVNCSFDYCDLYFDLIAGRASADSCHFENNLDTNYFFKLKNEATAVTLDKCEIVSNSINRSKYELFYVDPTVTFGGLTVSDCLFSFGSGYSKALLTAGKGRAIARNILTFNSNVKPPFSYHMNLVRNGLDDANAMAQFTLTGTVLPVLNTVTKYEGVGSMYFGPSLKSSQAEIILPILPGQQLRSSVFYKKQKSIPGQAKFQITMAYLDVNGTVIGSTATVLDVDGALDWTNARPSLSLPASSGTRYVKIRYIKSADTGAVGEVFIDDVVFNVL